MNTLPENTLEALSDHATLVRSIDTVESIANAFHVWDALSSAGIDIDDVAQVLEAEGVASFAKSFDDLIATLQSRASEFMS